MYTLDPATITKFCEHPKDYFLRVCKGKSHDTLLIRAESKKSLWTWIKLIFDRKSYHLSKIMNALGELPQRSFSRDFLEALKQRVNITKYEKHHPTSHAVANIFYTILRTGTPVAPPLPERPPEPARPLPSQDMPLAVPPMPEIPPERPLSLHERPSIAPPVPEMPSEPARPPQEVPPVAPIASVPVQPIPVQPPKQSKTRPFPEIIGVAPLTNEQFEATLGGGHLYSEEFRSNVYRFHTHGHLWTQAQHQDLFAQGLLRHYTGTALGLGNTEGIKTFFKLRIPPQIDLYDHRQEVEDCRMETNNFLDNLKEYLPRQLLELGGRFHKYKIMGEKIYKLCLRYERDPEVQKKVSEVLSREDVRHIWEETGVSQINLGNFCAALDGETDKIQTMIFHWVENISYQIRQKARRGTSQRPKLPSDSVPLQVREPAFLGHPECQKILRQQIPDAFELLFQQFVEAGLIDLDR